MSVRSGTQGARFSAQNRMRALQTDIMNLILERRLSPGDPMPTEAELSEELGIGRNTLREALKVLQALGVVEIRHGFGMFVAPSNFDALADGLTFRGRLSLQGTGHEAMELVDIRQALETGLIGAAMAEMTSADHADLDELVTGMEVPCRSREELLRHRRDLPLPPVLPAGQPGPRSIDGRLLAGVQRDPAGHRAFGYATDRHRVEAPCDSRRDPYG